MYNYVNFAPGDPFANSNSHGGSGSFTYKRFDVDRSDG